MNMMGRNAFYRPLTFASNARRSLISSVASLAVTGVLRSFKASRAACASSGVRFSVQLVSISRSAL
jgi:hypothetical protein